MGDFSLFFDLRVVSMNSTKPLHFFSFSGYRLIDDMRLQFTGIYKLSVPGVIEKSTSLVKEKNVFISGAAFCVRFFLLGADLLQNIPILIE